MGDKIIEFYRKHGIMTEIKTMSHMVSNLPKDIPSIVSTVQNVFIHQHWAERYGLQLDNTRNKEPWLRSVEEKLIFLNKRGYSHVLDKKKLENKMVAICRDFSIMAAALCIEVGIPARARCGFATYFDKGKYIDHWVLEYWSKEDRRWKLVDPQLDDFQKEILGISFDTLDVEDKHFITAPRAWGLCRQNKLNPDLFGILNWWGYDYIKSNLILDANSLLKIPMQPWDTWQGYKELPVSEWSEEDFIVMDQLSNLILSVNEDLQSLQNYIAENDKIKVPEDLSKVYNAIRWD